MALSDGPIKPGQVWQEKKQRKEYGMRRLLEVVSVGPQEITRFGVDVTMITFKVKDGREGLAAVVAAGEMGWHEARRPMMAFGLRKNWKRVI